MQKILMIGLLTLNSVASAVPQFVEMFQPKAERALARCVQGEKDALMTFPKSSEPDFTAKLKAYSEYLKSLPADRSISLTDIKSYPATPFIRVQTTYGSAFNVCKNAAVDLKTRPDVSKMPMNVWVYAGGRVSELRYAKDWKMVLVFRDGAGNEIGRFTPSDSKVGELNDWEVSCSSRPCYYSGTNAYVFQATPELLAAAGKASKMGVLTSFGSYGIKEYEVPLAELTNALK